MAARKKNTPVKEESLLNRKIILLAVIPFLAYIRVLHHEFVNWDDIVYIMNNDMITTFSWNNLERIMSAYFMGNYHPFILLSFAFDFHLFQFAAPGYHVHNLLLHIANTGLVYAFFYRLLDRQVNISLTIALIFSLHPMHVESVAWVSERKDLLYTLYYFLGLLAYLSYKKNGSPWRYLLMLVFFLCSLLSKAQAVTFPLVLFLIDYYLAGRLSWKQAAEKIPFLALSLGFGIIAIFAQKANGYINPHSIPLSSSIFYAPLGLWMYLYKFFLPVNQVAVYTYPFLPADGLPWYIWLTPTVFVFIGIMIWKTAATRRYITFGLLFFLATIFPVLQFLPVGFAIIAERYTYIPYIGLAMVVAMLFWGWRPRLAPGKRNLADAAAVMVILAMALLTWNRTQVWKDSVALWTDVMEKDPRCISAYINRAFIYNENKQYDAALKDCTDGLKVDPANFTLYKNRGIAYGIIGKNDLALADYSSAIRNNPQDYDSYLYRGILYTDKFGLHDSAIADFRKYLTIHPGNLNASFNMIVAHWHKGEFDSAKVWCGKVLQIDPGNQQALQLLEQIDKIKP